MCGQSIEINNSASRVVDQKRAGLHARQLIVPDHVLGVGCFRHMQRDDVCACQQIAECVRWLDVTVAQLIARVEINDAHAHGFGKVRELRANVAIADNTKCLAADFVRAVCVFVPLAMMGANRLREDPAHQHDNLGNRQFGNAPGIRKWCVENRYAFAVGGVECNLIGAD